MDQGREPEQNNSNAEQGSNVAPQQPAPTPAPPAPQAPAAQPAPDLPDWALRERKELRDEAANWRTKLREEQQRWEGGRTKDEVAALEEKIVKLEAESARQKAAFDAGLDASYAARLVGNSPEEWEKDAKQLASDMNRGGRQLSGGLNPGTPSEGDDIADRVAALRRGRIR